MTIVEEALHYTTKPMQKYPTLPEGYSRIAILDLLRNKRQALIVNLLCLAIAVIMIAPATSHIAQSFKTADATFSLIHCAALLVGLISYLILHELTHGIFMRSFSGVRPHYGFNGFYAYAGSEAYFRRCPYIIIALAPIVIWGIVLLIINLTVPAEWFDKVYIIQIINCSGAAGDIYVTYRMLHMPKDILVNDTGVAMSIYSKEF
jgi:hypothetical protein